MSDQAGTVSMVRLDFVMEVEGEALEILCAIRQPDEIVAGIDGGTVFAWNGIDEETMRKLLWAVYESGSSFCVASSREFLKSGPA